jgi:hypothetical protein
MSQLRDALTTRHVHCFQVKRAKGFYDKGVYRRLGEPELIWARGDIQPASQEQVERLPEGARADGAITIFTLTHLRTSESPNSVADKVLYQGVEYEVSQAERWPSHHAYTCTKVGQ